MLLRHIAPELDVDTALVSKMERGEKTPKREHVLAFAKVLNINPEEIITLCLADQVGHLIENETQAANAIKNSSQSYIS